MINSQAGRQGIKNDQGFTLVELLMAFLIIGILANLGATYLADIRKRSADTVAISEGRNLIQAANEAFLDLEDVDLDHSADGGSQVGTKKSGGGDSRDPIFTLAENIRARIEGECTGQAGSGTITAYVYHINGTEDSFTDSTKREFLYIVDVPSGTFDLAEW